VPEGAEFIKTNAGSWADLSAAFKKAGKVDIAVANAGISENKNTFVDEFDEDGELKEPSGSWTLVDVNLKGVISFTKLAMSYMKRQGTGGSIVITSSATAYAPEHSLPVYSACKLGVSLSWFIDQHVVWLMNTFHSS